MDILIGLGGLLVGVAGLGGWYTLRAKRDNLDADSDSKHIASLLSMWDTAEAHNAKLELQYRRCHDRKRSLEAAAYEFGMPVDLIQEALKQHPE